MSHPHKLLEGHQSATHNVPIYYPFGTHIMTFFSQRV